MHSDSNSNLQLSYQSCIQTICAGLRMLTDEVPSSSISLQTNLFADRTAVAAMRPDLFSRISSSQLWVFVTFWKPESRIVVNVWSISGKRQRQQPYMTWTELRSDLLRGVFWHILTQKCQTGELFSSYMSLTDGKYVRREIQAHFISCSHINLLTA